MKNLKELMQKMDKVTFTDSEETKLISDTFTLSHRYELNQSRGAYKAVVQIVINLEYEGVLLTTWGCLESEQSEYIDWFLKTQNRAYQNSRILLQDDEARGNKALNDL